MCCKVVRNRHQVDSDGDSDSGVGSDKDRCEESNTRLVNESGSDTSVGVDIGSGVESDYVRFESWGDFRF